MAMVGVAYSRITAQVGWLSLSVGGAVLHSSNEPGELLQWQHHKHRHWYYY